MGNIYSVLTEVCSRVGTNINYMTNTSLGSDLHVALHQTTQGPIKEERSPFLLPAAYGMNVGTVSDCCDLREGLSVFPAPAHPHRLCGCGWHGTGSLSWWGCSNSLENPLWNTGGGGGGVQRQVVSNLQAASLSQRYIYSFIICKEQLVPHPAARSAVWLSNLQADLWSVSCFSQ